MSKVFSSGLVRWFVFAGILIAGFILTSGTKSYSASGICLQDTSRSGKDMPADTGMMQKSHGGMKAMMGEMRDSMMNARKTGNPDEDFAAMMIQHHKGAIRMSQDEVNKGKDEKVISMAEKTIKDQQNEIQDLQKYVNTDQSKTGMTMPRDTSMLKGKEMQEETGMTMPQDTSMRKGKEMQEETGSSRQHAMMDRMQNMQMTGDQDKDYVSMMVMHHQHAIDMANAYLNKGENQDLIKLAKNMIKYNEDQIKDLENWEMDKVK